MKKCDDFLKKVIIAMGIFLLCFTIAVFAVFCFTGGSEPSTLIACVFAACLGEGSICGFLKKEKDKSKKEEKTKKQTSKEVEDDIEVAG